WCCPSHWSHRRYKPPHRQPRKRTKEAAAGRAGAIGATWRVSSGVEVAFGLGRVIAQRVEIGPGMEEAVLGRNGHQHQRRGEQDRLAQLLIPVAKGEADALEGAELKLIGEQEGPDRLG